MARSNGGTNWEKATAVDAEVRPANGGMTRDGVRIDDWRPSDVCSDGGIEDQAIDGAQLLDDLVAYCRKYGRVGEDEYAVLAAHVLHCHSFAAFSRTPYLHVKSPTPECGKTQLLETLKLVLPKNTQMACSMTAAVLARFTDRYHAPLLLDEVDKLKAGDKDLYNAVMGIVNGGYKASGNRMLLVPAKGGDWQLKNLSTFSPKIMAGISGLEPATASRCIPIHMERLLPDDSVDDIDEYITEPEAKAIQERAEQWSVQNIDKLKRARPDSRSGLRSRHREVSRPLFAVGDLAGPEWGKRIREAILRLFTSQAAEPTDDIKAELLADIKQLFGDMDRMASADLVEALCKLEDGPWPHWGKNGKPINQNQLARLLRDFKVSPRPMRLDDGRRLKGYEREHFQPVWDRYLPHTSIQTVTPCSALAQQDLGEFSNSDTEIDVTVEKCEKPASILHCHAVTVQKPERGGVDTKKPWTEGVTCPGCKGSWSSTQSLAHHLPHCGPLDYPAMRLTALRLEKGLPVTPELKARHDQIISLGLSVRGLVM